MPDHNLLRSTAQAARQGPRIACLLWVQTVRCGSVCHSSLQTFFTNLLVLCLILLFVICLWYFIFVFVWWIGLNAYWFIGLLMSMLDILIGVSVSQSKVRVCT